MKTKEEYRKEILETDLKKIFADAAKEEAVFAKRRACVRKAARCPVDLLSVGGAIAYAWNLYGKSAREIKAESELIFLVDGLVSSDGLALSALDIAGQYAKNENAFVRQLAVTCAASICNQARVGVSRPLSQPVAVKMLEDAKQDPEASIQQKARHLLFSTAISGGSRLGPLF